MKNSNGLPDTSLPPLPGCSLCGDTGKAITFLGSFPCPACEDRPRTLPAALGEARRSFGQDCLALLYAVAITLACLALLAGAGASLWSLLAMDDDWLLAGWGLIAAALGLGWVACWAAKRRER